MNATLDHDWVVGCLARWRTDKDTESLGQLLKWQRDRAYATAARMLGPGPDAEDTVQQAFLKMLSRKEGFETTSTFRMAVYRAVVQCALDLARSRRSRTERERGMQTISEASKTTPQQKAESAERIRLLREEYGHLSLEQRAVLALCCHEGLNVTQAATVLSTPRETVRDLYANTLKQLRLRLKKRGLVLSLLPIMNLLKEDTLPPAPETLCKTLDAHLPGSPCNQISTAENPPVDPFHALSDSGLDTSALPWKWVAAATVVMTAGIVWFNQRSVPAAAAKPTLSLKAAPIESASRPTPPSTSAQPDPSRKMDALPEAKAAQTAIKFKGNIPPHIRAAAEASMRGIRITEIEREVLDRKIVYEVEGLADGKRYDILVSEAGKVLKIEVDDDDEDEDEDDHDEAEAKPKPVPVDPEEF